MDIVDLDIENGGYFHRYLYVYQKVIYIYTSIYLLIYV